MARVPSTFDYLIIQQFDPLVTVPSGVETVIRGILKHASGDKRIGVVGVDRLGSPDRDVQGQWEEVRFGANSVWFLPVCRLSSEKGRKIIPHSVRLAVGAIRYRRRIPPSTEIHSHRADIAAFARLVWSTARHRYFIHTQERGLLGANSESLWRRAGRIHVFLEQIVVRRADYVHVFNPTYIDVIKDINSSARFSPTWWDPDITVRRDAHVNPYSVLWAGRLEQPKNPLLAVKTFQWLHEQYPNEPWQLTMVGTGSLMENLQDFVTSAALTDVVHLPGRRDATDLGVIRSSHHTMLMTSVAGYEGFPMVLVEGLAAGLTAVVTDGSDTGSLITAGINGYVCSPGPAALGEALRNARRLPSDAAVESVEELHAPWVIADLFLND